MKLRIVSIAMMICLLAAPAVQAAPHFQHKPEHHPVTPPRPIFRPYHRPMPRYRPYPRYRNYRYCDNDDNIWIGIGAGLLIGSIISNMNRTPEYYPQDVHYSDPNRNDYSYSNSYERETEIRDIRARISEKAKTEAIRASKMVSEFGPGRAAELLARIWEEEGKRTSIDSRNGLQVLKVAGFYDGSQMSYAFLPENRKVYVRISVPEYSLSVEESEYYSGYTDMSSRDYPVEGSRVSAEQSKASSVIFVSDKSSILQYAGFELEKSKRSSSGYMVIKTVGKGTAAYYAGIRPGDLLLKVDVYDTRNFDPAWFSEYIASRYQSKSLMRLLISHNGTEKKIEIQL